MGNPQYLQIAAFVKQGKLILFYLNDKFVKKRESCQFECFEERKTYRE